jgi:YHS domain-containing protein/ferredoxin
MLFGLISAVVVITNVPDGATPPGPTGPVCEPCGMEVDPQGALAKTINGRIYYFCHPNCYDRMLAGRTDTPPDANVGSRHVDPVCNMEVSPAWGIRSEHLGQMYHFCTERCRESFDSDPETFLVSRCMVCTTPLASHDRFEATYLGKTYELCSEEHRAEFKSDPAAFFMHSMWGIPSWLYYTSIALVLIVSFGLFDWLSRWQSRRASRRQSSSPGTTAADGWAPNGASHAASATTISLPILSANVVSAAMPSAIGSRAGGNRFDLLSIGVLRAAVRSRGFRFAVQLVMVILFTVIIAAGLFGNQNPALNIAPLMTWTIWWGLLPVLILFAGKAWCYACPWDAVAGWLEKLRLWKKTDDGISMNHRWPRAIRNVSIATILFVGLTWVELGFGVTMRPMVTAYLALGMLFMAIVSAMLFDKKSFCRYGCLVGRVSGLYALFGGTEVRSRSAAVCDGCRTKECVKGSDTAYGCPTFLYPGKLDTNTYCIQCMECVQACPHDNLAVNLRPWGADLAIEGKPRSDEAYLALLMLSITGFHGLTMTPAWQQLIDWIRGSVDFGRVLGFSSGMALIMLAPIGIYAALIGVSMLLGQAHALKPLTYRDYFVRYAYALLPIALFYHIAHNLEHLLMEGPKVLAMVSDPLGWSWNLFGSAGWSIPPLISLSNLWVVQVLLVLIGHVYSLWVAQKVSLRLFGGARAAFRSQLPMLVGMIAFSVFSLWLLKQPMEMRTSAM